MTCDIYIFLKHKNDAPNNCSNNHTKTKNKSSSRLSFRAFLSIVRDGVRIIKRLVSGREAGGQTDAHASAITVGRLERTGVDGLGAAGEELEESTDSGAGIEPKLGQWFGGCGRWRRRRGQRLRE